jgi:hypothetical protein
MVELNPILPRPARHRGLIVNRLSIPRHAIAPVDRC